MTFQNPVSPYTCLDTYAKLDGTFALDGFEDFCFWEESTMPSNNFASDQDGTAFETSRLCLESVDIKKSISTEAEGRKECLPPTVTGDPRDRIGDTVSETFQVEDVEESHKPGSDAALQVKDGGKPQNPEGDTFPELIYTKDEQICSPKQHTPPIQLEDVEESYDLEGDAALQVEDGGKPQNSEDDAFPEIIQTEDGQICSPKQNTPPIQIKDVKESHSPGSDAAAERGSDSGADERLQSKNVVDSMVVLRRAMLRRAGKHKTFPTEDDSKTLRKLEDMINGLRLTQNLVDSCKFLRSAKMTTFLKSYIQKIDSIPDDKFQMKERAETILKTTRNVITSADLSQTPLTFADTSDISICQTKEDIKQGCKLAPITIDDGDTTEEDVIEERTSPKVPSSRKRKLECQADPPTVSSSPRRSPRKTSAQQYVSQERQILTKMRKELQCSMQNLQELRESRQKLEKEFAQSLQKLAKDEQGLGEVLRGIMTSIIELGALEEDVSEEWGARS